MLLRIVQLLAALAIAGLASAQEVPFGPLVPTDAPAIQQASLTPDVGPFVNGGINPIALLEDSADAIPGFEGGLSGALNIIVLLTVLTLAPAIVISCTSFIRIVIVLGMLKQALGTQNLPPGQVVVALAMFMTFMIMSPTLERINEEAIVPYRNGEIVNQLDMWNNAKEPLRDFMFEQIDRAENWSSVYTILNYRGVDTTEPETLTRADVDMLTLVPAYMLSELKVAFLMGFRVYLPFLIIDMVVASLLISMSMMMLPPVLISLPFKVLLFVLVDGWDLVVGSLMVSFAQPDVVAYAPMIAPLIGSV
ncbi:MAG: flagellar type III secretion system pore protein FliP [Phycisphaerales bacterium]